MPPPLKILQVERLIAKQAVQIVRQICKENIFCWKKTECLTKTTWKYLEAWWTELRWCKNWGEVPLCSWLRQVRLEWCSVWNILVLGKVEKNQFVASFGRRMIRRKLDDNWVISRSPFPTLEWLSGHLTWGHWRFSQWCSLCRWRSQSWCRTDISCSPCGSRDPDDDQEWDGCQVLLW